MFDRILAGVRRRFDRMIFNITAKDVLSLPPIKTNKSENRLSVVSMVSHRDLYMYLVAIKSFHGFVKFGKFIVLDDGSLTNSDRDIIKEHIVGVEFYHIADVKTGSCPKGGCWERLSLIIELSKSSYVIQLDSDTITTSFPNEVIDSIKKNSSFALPTLEDKGFLTLEEIYGIVKDWDIDFVQVHAEREMKNININLDNPMYIRANAAFAGFAKGEFSFDLLENFSKEMERLLGKDMWRHWGSEQVASNFMIANSPLRIALPYPKYAGYYPDRRHIDFNKSAFLHFIGTQRFKNGFYVKKVKEFLKSAKM